MTLEGQFAQLLRLFLSPGWREIWEAAGLTVVSFASLGLAVDVPDVVVWQTCQERQVVLVTGKRNHESPDSLEAAIRQYNRTDSLPVFTISAPREFSLSRSYAERTAEKLLEYLLDLDTFRGTGRLYIP